MSNKITIKSHQNKNFKQSINQNILQKNRNSNLTCKNAQFLVKVKNQILKDVILEQYENLPEKLIKSAKLTIEEYKYLKEYGKYYEKYGINETIKKYINRMIKDNRYLTSDFKVNELHEILLKISQKFSMNEYDFVLYAAYLDKLKWKKESYSAEDFLTIVALFLKLRTIDNASAYISYIGLENQDVIGKLKDFLEINHETNFNIKINQWDLNEKFKELNKPSNIYCKENYIDYNYIVDQILKMSVTYNEKSKDKALGKCGVKKKKNNSKAKNKIFSKENEQFTNNVQKDNVFEMKLRESEDIDQNLKTHNKNVAIQHRYDFPKNVPNPCMPFCPFHPPCYGFPHPCHFSSHLHFAHDNFNWNPMFTNIYRCYPIENSNMNFVGLSNQLNDESLDNISRNFYQNDNQFLGNKRRNIHNSSTYTSKNLSNGNIKENERYENSRLNSQDNILIENNLYRSGNNIGSHRNSNLLDNKISSFKDNFEINVINNNINSFQENLPISNIIKNDSKNIEENSQIPDNHHKKSPLTHKTENLKVNFNKKSCQQNQHPKKENINECGLQINERIDEKEKDSLKLKPKNENKQEQKFNDAESINKLDTEKEQLEKNTTNEEDNINKTKIMKNYNLFNFNNKQSTLTTNKNFFIAQDQHKIKQTELEKNINFLFIKNDKKVNNYNTSNLFNEQSNQYLKNNNINDLNMIINNDKLLISKNSGPNIFVGDKDKFGLFGEIKNSYNHINIRTNISNKNNLANDENSDEYKNSKKVVDGIEKKTDIDLLGLKEYKVYIEEESNKTIIEKCQNSQNLYENINSNEQREGNNIQQTISENNSKYEKFSSSQFKFNNSFPDQISNFNQISFLQNNYSEFSQMSETLKNIKNFNSIDQVRINEENMNKQIIENDDKTLTLKENSINKSSNDSSKISQNSNLIEPKNNNLQMNTNNKSSENNSNHMEETNKSFLKDDSNNHHIYEHYISNKFPVENQFDVNNRDTIQSLTSNINQYISNVNLSTDNNSALKLQNILASNFLNLKPSSFFKSETKILPDEIVSFNNNDMNHNKKYKTKIINSNDEDRNIHPYCSINNFNNNSILRQVHNNSFDQMSPKTFTEYSKNLSLDDHNLAKIPYFNMNSSEFSSSHLLNKFETEKK